MGGGCGGGGRKVCRKRALDFCGGWGTRNSLTNCHICKKEGVCVCVCAAAAHTHTLRIEHFADLCRIRGRCLCFRWD